MRHAKPQHVKRNDPASPDFASIEDHLSAQYIANIKSRLNGNTPCSKDRLRKDAEAVGAAILNTDPAVIAEMVIAAKRGQAKQLLELMNELIDHGIDTVGISRACADIDRDYPEAA